jgi:MOSC domain-containing protein YiiM
LESGESKIRKWSLNPSIHSPKLNERKVITSEEKTGIKHPGGMSGAVHLLQRETFPYYYTEIPGVSVFTAPSYQCNFETTGDTREEKVFHLLPTAIAGVGGFSDPHFMIFMR